MLAEEKKFLSIPKAIGLFMILKSLFYRDALANFTANTSLGKYCIISDQISFYGLLILGFLLCITYSKKLIHIVSILLVINLFGGIYIITDINATAFKSTAIIGAHASLLFVLYWSSNKIEKIKAAFGDNF